MFKLLRAKLWLMSVSKKEDVEAFWSSSFNRLLGDQVIAILRIIDEELVKSFHFGLKISRAHVLKEKHAVLAVLNIMGNLNAIPQRFSYEEARKVFLESLSQIMEDEYKFYFEKANRKKDAVKNKYNCHIDAIASSIIRSIYEADGKIPYIKR